MYLDKRRYDFELQYFLGIYSEVYAQEVTEYIWSPLLLPGYLEVNKLFQL